MLAYSLDTERVYSLARLRVLLLLDPCSNIYSGFGLFLEREHISTAVE